ncbi:MAG TPA: IclR family transcriptional regulator C-terminal domain-containing protein [Steroidobacteraceae bacterium]|nr:IclR family transcriptional regulator C-terminal domain-containing protein [Steroidobacteraceae bacterium]
MTTSPDSAEEPTPVPGIKPRRPASSDQMGGFAKGLSVIEAYGKGRTSLTIAEVARLSGLDRASARRCLLTLVNNGYATTDGRYFELTPRILRLGQAYLAAPLPRLIQPSLDRLAKELHESCSASVLDGNEIVYIASTAHDKLMDVGLYPGSRLPAYCTSMGRVLLAALPAEQSRALLEATDRKAITARTLTDVDALMAELDRIRTQGHAVADQEVEIGSMSIAVPIRNVSGRTMAALSVTAHATPAMTERLRDEILQHLKQAQAQLAEALP